MKNLGLIPLRNFGKVVDGVYRSAQPLYGYEYEWIRDTLGVKHIVNLRSESSHDDDFSKFGLGVLHINIADHHCPTMEQVHEFIEFIKKIESPVLIHCAHGRGRTSIFSVLTKIAKGWPLHKALLDEHTRFHHVWKHPHQLEFLKTLSL